MALDNSSQNRSKLISYVILTGDIILLNLVVLLCSTINPDIKSDSLSWGELHILNSVAYLLSSGSGSVILHHRKVHAYQIVRNVFRNVCFYTFICILMFYPGTLVDVFTSTFITYILMLLFILSAHRLICRSIVKTWRRNGKNLKHIVFVGSRYNMVELYRAFTEDRSTGYAVHGYFADEQNSNFGSDCPYLGTPDEVIPWLEQHKFVQQLYCNLPSACKDTIIPIINYCENNLVHFYSLPNLYNYMHHRVYLDLIQNIPYLSLRETPLERTENRFIKRTFDLIISTIFLCTLFPVILLVVTIITKITMPGPIFFKQKRNGLNDKEFYCYKFRSMKVNKEADTVQATEHDPRKTKWGNIMRKTSIDELPQFINVLKGDMSIVGPRPHMVKHTLEYSRLIDKYMVRHFVKPGITGWSQVTGFRGETKELKDMEGRIKGDIWYIEHWNFWLDIYIMYKTVANAIHGEKKAY